MLKAFLDRRTLDESPLMARFPLVLSLALVVLTPQAGRAQPAGEGDLAADEKLLREAGVAIDGPGLLAFFHRRTPAPAARQQNGELVRRLGSGRYADRQKATEALKEQGARVLGELREALKSSDAEVRRRAQECLDA